MSLTDPPKPPATQHVETSAVSVKIPPFWVDRPEMWFYQVEAQFKISGITSEDTKFNYLIAQLEPRFVENIWDIVKDASTTKYSLAKDRLLKTFQESENKKIKLLISGLELGDWTPSQLLRKMRSLGGTEFSDKVLRTLWLEKMPSSVKNILIVSEESLDKLATMADKIMEMTPRSTDLSEVKATATGTDSTPVDDLLLKRISALELQIAALSEQRHSRDQRRYNYRNRSRSRSRKRYDPNGKLCFYHFKFGAKCRPEKCVQPCAWKIQGNHQTQ